MPHSFTKALHSHNVCWIVSDSQESHQGYRALRTVQVFFFLKGVYPNAAGRRATTFVCGCRFSRSAAAQNASAPPDLQAPSEVAVRKYFFVYDFISSDAKQVGELLGGPDVQVVVVVVVSPAASRTSRPFAFKRFISPSLILASSSASFP